MDALERLTLEMLASDGRTDAQLVQAALGEHRRATPG